MTTMKRHLLKLLLGCLLFLPLSPMAQPEYGEEEPGIWIDLRSPGEYRQGHLEGAINIPRGEIAHRINDYVSDPYLPVHLYDSSAGAAGLALDILMEMGFQYVINEGSYEAVLARLQQ